MENPDVSDAEFAGFVAGHNLLGTELLRDLAAPTANFVVSPTSAVTALAMTYAGARGSTADGMREALNDTLPEGKYHAAANRLLRTLRSRQVARHRDQFSDVQKQVEVKLADQLWAQHGMSVSKDFLDLLASQYDAGVMLADFRTNPNGERKAINGWVAQQTNDRIQELLSESDITSDVRLVLVNALYVNASWGKQFNPDFTKPATFHRSAGGDIEVQTMHDERSAPFKVTEDFRAVDLAYDGGALSLTIVLPEPNKYESVRALLGTEALTAALSDLTPTSVEISLPKVKLEGPTFSLSEPLKALGMDLAFTEAADFSGITGDHSLLIRDVLQQDFISIHEAGSEAAAATAVVLGVSSIAPPTDAIIVDRPYFFFLRDATGLILFAGQVNDPS